MKPRRGDPMTGPDPLGPEELFGLVADECFRDGRVEAVENELLNSLIRVLALDRSRAVERARQAQQRFAAGALGAAGPLDRAALVERIEQAIRSDGIVEDSERALLGELRVLLGLPEPAEVEPDAEETGGTTSGAEGAPARPDAGTPPEDVPKPAGKADSAGRETRQASSRRVRVTRREFVRFASPHLDAEAVPRFWHGLTARCPGRPRFEGPDVLFLIGGVMVLYGLGWLADRLHDLLGVMIPSLAAGAGSLALAFHADRIRSQGGSTRTAGLFGFLAAVLGGGALAGIAHAIGLEAWLGRTAWGRTLFSTYLASLPLAIGGGLLARGLQSPHLLFLVLAGVSLVGLQWIDLVLSPGRTLSWALAVVWGSALLRFGFALDRRTAEDLAQAPYILGLGFFWGFGLCGMPWHGEVAWLAFAIANLGLMALSAALERGMFLTCGALGVYAWLGHLAFSVFRSQLLFPFVLTLVGLSVMGSGLWYQRNQEGVRVFLLGLIPETLRPVLPADRPAAAVPPGPEPPADPIPSDPGIAAAPESASRLDVSEDDVARVAEAMGIPSTLTHGLWERLLQGSPVRARLTGAHILYFLGALTVIASMTFFMGLCWSTLGSGAVLLLSLLYAGAFAAAGLWLWQSPESLPGGLLVTMAVCMTPLATWAFQSATGIWPHGNPGAYQGFYVWVKGSWIVIEVATVAAGLVALRFVRFPFLTAPMAFALWYMSMDLTPLLVGEANFSWKARCWVSVGFGALMLAASRFADRKTDEDYSWWGYLFGTLAFWGGLSSMGSGSAFGKLAYAAVNAGMMLLGARIERQVLVGFGFLGFHAVVAGELFRIFRDIPGFPLLVALAGCGLILAGRWLKQNRDRFEALLG